MMILKIFSAFDTILLRVSPAKSESEKPLLFQPFNLGYDDFLGRLAIGRVYEGIIRAGQSLTLKRLDGKSETGRITKLFTFNGTRRQESDQAIAGDIVMVAGFSSIDIGETLCESTTQEALPAITVDEPTISSGFL